MTNIVPTGDVEKLNAEIARLNKELEEAKASKAPGSLPKGTSTSGSSKTFEQMLAEMKGKDDK